MAFPQVASITETNTNSGAPIVGNLPATVNSGDLLLAFTSTENNPGTATDPGGWTRLVFAGSSPVRLGVWYRIADGSEAGGTISVTVQFSPGFTCAQVYRITGWHGSQAPEIGTLGSGVTGTPDPGAVTATWGSDDNLFIVVLAAADDPHTVDTWPTNYDTAQTSTIQGDSANKIGRAHV